MTILFPRPGITRKKKFFFFFKSVAFVQLPGIYATAFFFFFFERTYSHTWNQIL